MRITFRKFDPKFESFYELITVLKRKDPKIAGNLTKMEKLFNNQHMI